MTQQPAVLRLDFELLAGRIAGGGHNLIGDFLAQVGNLFGKLDRAAGGFAKPERHARRLALGILHDDVAAADGQYPPRGVAQQEDVACFAVDGEVLVDGTHHLLLRIGHHAVDRHVWDRPAGSRRADACPTPRT